MIFKPRISFNQLFFPHDNKAGHIKALDGLRGVAVLLVVCSHAAMSDLYIHESLNWVRGGKMGVYLFFLLSAYLLDRQIALAFRRGNVSVRYWANYFLRRILRIYPLFILAIAAYGIMTLAGIPTFINRLTDVPAHLLLLRGNGIFWSIPVEFKYYFFSPLLLWVCHRFLRWDWRKVTLLLLAITVASIILQYLFSFSNISTLRYLPLFLAGTLLSLIEVAFQKERPHSQSYAKLFDGFGLIAAGILGLSIPLYFSAVFGFILDIHQPVFTFPYAILWTAVLVAVRYGSGILRCIFEFKPLRFLGTISFSVYLFHLVIIVLVDRSEIPQWSKFYVYFVATIAVSSITYLVVERPLARIRLKDMRPKKTEQSI
jgi:peptidoglycan/LPS O-acetylase OafA/YrhL